MTQVTKGGWPLSFGIHLSLFPCVGHASHFSEVLEIQSQVLTITLPALYPPSLPILPSDPTFNHPLSCPFLVTLATKPGTSSILSKSSVTEYRPCLHTSLVSAVLPGTSACSQNPLSPPLTGLSHPSPAPSQSTCVDGRTPWWAGSS